MNGFILVAMQGGKVLLVAESAAFFTVYRTITDAGLRAFQLDRDSQQGTDALSREVRACTLASHFRSPAYGSSARRAVQFARHDCGSRTVATADLKQRDVGTSSI